MALRIVINKIPRLAVIFYLIGFCLIITALVFFFYWPSLFAPVKLQQTFIAGAILVAVGSVVNTLYQFRRKPKD